MSLLRQRDFRLLFSAQAISLLGDGMINVALAFAVLEVGGSASSVGLVFAARTAPMLVSLVVGGVIADRTSRRAVMIGADVTRVLSQGAMGALLISGGADVATLALLAALTGAATGLSMPAATGLLPTVVHPDDLQRANGLRLTAMAGGEILGPLVAGGLVVAAGAGWAIAIDAATFAVSALLLARLAVEAEAPAAAKTFVNDLRDGWRAFRGRTWVWTMVLVASLENLFWGAWTALGAVVADDSLGGAGAWGTVLAAMGVGGVLGGLVAMRIAPRRPLVLFSLAGAVLALPVALLAAEAPLAVVAAGALVAGVALMLGNTLFESTLQRHIPANEISRVASYDWLGSLALRPLGLAIWGPLAVAIGTSEALWLAAALLLAAALAPLLVRDVRELPAQPAQPTT